MPIACKFERSLLDFDEYKLIRETHHPHIYAVSDEDLKRAQESLRQIRSKEQTLARQKRREVRGKAEPRGASFPGTAERPHQRKTVVTSAIKRVQKELKRRRAVEARAANLEAARKALAMNRAAKFAHHPSGEVSPGEDFRPLPSRRPRFEVPRSRIGSISQHTKTSQAIRDARN